MEVAYLSTCHYLTRGGKTAKLSDPCGVLNCIWWKIVRMLMRDPYLGNYFFGDRTAAARMFSDHLQMVVTHNQGV
jgi:hypothetical protein